ncbi:MAG: hypothetical protein ABL911_11450 [Gallionella sp.]
MASNAAVKGDVKTTKAATKRKTDFSNPYVLKLVKLSTTPAQMVYEITFDECSGALRNLSSVLPTLVKNQTEMMTVNGVVDHLINTQLSDLRKESARIKKIAEDNGIEIGKLHYTSVQEVQAKLTCNKAGQFLTVISELDDLICLVHSAWFAGFIADDVKSSLERQWRRKAVGVAAEIKNITNRAFRANSKNSDPDDTQTDTADKVVASDTTTDKPKRAKSKSNTIEAAASKVEMAEAVVS